MKTPISPKVIVGTLVAVLAYGAVAALAYLQTPNGVALFDHLPPVPAAAVKAIVPAAAFALAAYLKTDALRISEADLPDPDGYEPRHAATDGDLVFADGADEPVDEAADPEPADYRPGA